jgi:predicted nucleic acid-binding protein
MTGTSNFEYWDTCIFLAFLQNENHRPGELDYIKEQAQKFDLGALTIVTSSITVVELLEARLTADVRSTWKQMIRRSNFQFVEAGQSICELAALIRNYYKSNEKFWPTTPDALHVASAIAAQTSIGIPIRLLTLDSDDKSKDSEKGLTKLNGKIAGAYDLLITRPPTQGQQAHLDL